MSTMSEQEILELAAILVNEHGSAALDLAKRRRQQFAHEPRSAGYRVWSQIVGAVENLLEKTPHTA